MEKIILTIIAFFVSSACYAGDFNLNSISADDLNLEENILEVMPAPAYNFSQSKAPALAPVLDLTLKLPFKALNERLSGIQGITVLEKSAPILATERDHIIFTNVTVNVNGIEVEPTIRIKPWFEGKNRLALKFVKIDVDVVFGPKSRTLPAINKDEVMNFVVEKITDTLLVNMDAALALNEVNIEAKDLISFSYDKISWTLRCDISPKFIAPLMPGLLDNINLTSFSFDESGFALSVHSGSDIRQIEGYNLAMSDGLVTNFLKRYTAGTDFDLAPAGHDGGIKFRADGRAELTAMTNVKLPLKLKPDVCFTVTINPKVVAVNTIRLTFNDVRLNQVYGIGIPGFINRMIKNEIIKSVVNNITKNPELAKTMKAKKINDETVELNLENKAFLPSFAKGVEIRKMKINHGLIYVAFIL